MATMQRSLTACAAAIAIAVGGCASDSENLETGTDDGYAQARGEQAAGGEHGPGGRDEEGEEPATELGLDERHDAVRNGVRLVMEYDAEANAFRGTVENVTGETLPRVRVEVHLSNGEALGPTPAADLDPGQRRDVFLRAESTDFETWSAHPEVGRGGHAHVESDPAGR